MDGVSRVGQGAPAVVLASASPRRLAILRDIGVEPTVVAAAVDERPLDGEKPVDLVERLALAKARAVARSIADEPPAAGGRVVVGADTVIDLDGATLGKPVDRADGQRMLERLAGRAHLVRSGVAVIAQVGGREVEASAVATTDVVMRPYGADEIAWYLDAGEYEGKAGAYAIQGLGALLVEGIEGSYHNVVGLPVTTLDRLVAEVGLSLRGLPW